MEKVVFYHAGCPVCISAEKDMLRIIDRSKYDLQVVHLGEEKDKIEEAQQIGVLSVPALLLAGNILHINFGASISDLKNL